MDHHWMPYGHYQNELEPSSLKTGNDAVSPSFYFGLLNRLQ